MIVLATDAPLDARNLGRLAARAFAGMARTGASFGNGSGDYAIAFSTAAELRVRTGARTTGGAVLANEAVSPLFQAAADATEEAIVNSLLAAETTTGSGTTVPAVPLEELQRALPR
jgi:D-aminopeptidase